MPENIESNIYLFADDTKFFRTLHSPDDHETLQSDLNTLMCRIIVGATIHKILINRLYYLNSRVCPGHTLPLLGNYLLLNQINLITFYMNLVQIMLYNRSISFSQNLILKVTFCPIIFEKYMPAISRAFVVRE